MTLQAFKKHLQAKIEKLSRGDEAEQEGAGEIQSIIDFIDGKNTHRTSLQDACDWVSEPNLCQEAQ